MSVRVENLTVRAGRSTLVREVSFEVPAGSWCTIIGPNGAGKTSLITAMAGLRAPADGRVLVGEANVHERSERQRAQLLAFVPQHPTLPLGMTVREYVVLGRTAAHGALRGPSANDQALVDGVLERLSLTSFTSRDVATLSGGERQRAVLARTLAQGTTVVLLDEPITGLDVRHQLEIMALLKKEVDECHLTVVATLHDLTLAGAVTDQLILLGAGRLVARGAASEVLRSEALSEVYGTRLRVVRVDDRDIVLPSAIESPY